MEQLQTPTIGVTINKMSTTTEPPPVHYGPLFVPGQVDNFNISTPLHLAYT